jgi:hypothetical protein
MDCEANMHDLLERMLHDANLEPTQLPLSFRKIITDNFSDGRQIGSGGFAVVYKYQNSIPNSSILLKKRLKVRADKATHLRDYFRKERWL